MKFQSFRSAVVVASVIIGSVVPSQAFAQTQDYVLTGLTVNGDISGTLVSTYNFNQPMILNSIGFLSEGLALNTISYTVGSATTSLLESNLLPVDANGLRWYSLAGGGLSVNASTVLKVTTAGVLIPAYDDPMDGTFPAYYKTLTRTVGSTNASSNVTYNGLNVSGNTHVFTTYTNSNLRVSALGANVAPEPGTLALALTGGCALVGLYIRRRKAD